MDDKIKNSRINFEKLGSAYAPAGEITIQKELIGKVNVYWFHNRTHQRENKIMIYLHGGCFVLGSIHSHQALVSHIADKCKIPILFIEYSLAPENPFPAAINEILEVYQHVLKNSQPKDILFMGDSAGAALCMSVSSILNRKNLALPKQLIMISPWIDLRCNSH